MSDVRVVLNNGQLHQLLEGPSGPVAKMLTKSTLRVHRAAVQLCPVDVGRLQTSITWRIATDSRGLLGIVGTNVEYAPYQEFGTRYMAAQPFLRPALAAA